MGNVDLARCALDRFVLVSRRASVYPEHLIGGADAELTHVIRVRGVENPKSRVWVRRQLPRNIRKRLLRRRDIRIDPSQIDFMVNTPFLTGSFPDLINLVAPMSERLPARGGLVWEQRELFCDGATHKDAKQPVSLRLVCILASAAQLRVRRRSRPMSNILSSL